jgi:hypothetical protein
MTSRDTAVVRKRWLGQNNTTTTAKKTNENCREIYI